MTGEHTVLELMTFVGRSNRSKFREQVLAPLLASGVVEMTVPDKPNSSKQRYRLTAVGRALKAAPPPERLTPGQTHFAPAQSGALYTPPKVSAAVDRLH